MGCCKTTIPSMESHLKLPSASVLQVLLLQNVPMTYRLGAEKQISIVFLASSFTASHITQVSTRMRNDYRTLGGSSRNWLNINAEPSGRRPSTTHNVQLHQTVNTRCIILLGLVAIVDSRIGE